MDRDVIETDEDILTFEVADDALERAAVNHSNRSLHSLVRLRASDASQIQIPVRKSRSLGRYGACAQASSNVRFGS